MAEKYGVEHLKPLFKFGFDFGKQTEKALADKKFTVWDLPGYLDELLQIPGLVNSRVDIVNEFNDLHTGEEEELFEYAKSIAGFEDIDLREKVFKYINVGHAIVSLFIKDAPSDIVAEDDGGDHPSTPPSNG